MFVPISLDEFIDIHLENDPAEKSSVLRIKLETAIDAYRKGMKCSCGNDIWIVGAAGGELKCFQCHTGKLHPAGEYEIESVINKIDKCGRRHIDEIDPRKINGIFDDDGYEIKPEKIVKPSLCMICKKDLDPGPEDEIFCMLTRNDLKENKVFKCHSFERI